MDLFWKLQLVTEKFPLFGHPLEAFSKSKMASKMAAIFTKYSFSRITFTCFQNILLCSWTIISPEPQWLLLDLIVTCTCKESNQFDVSKPNRGPLVQVPSEGLGNADNTPWASQMKRGPDGNLAHAEKPLPPPIHLYTRCSRDCHSQIGLVSHTALVWQKEASDISSKSEWLTFSYFTYSVLFSPAQFCA